MQIVIDISDNDYEYLKNTSFVEDEKRIFEQTEEDRKSTITLFRLINSVKNNVPLPKGHGRLIDADITKDLKNKIKHYGKDYKFTQEEILNILERYEIKYTPTIIQS